MFMNSCLSSSILYRSLPPCEWAWRWPLSSGHKQPDDAHNHSVNGKALHHEQASELRVRNVFCLWSSITLCGVARFTYLVTSQCDVMRCVNLVTPHIAKKWTKRVAFKRCNGCAYKCVDSCHRPLEPGVHLHPQKLSNPFRLPPARKHLEPAPCIHSPVWIWRTLGTTQCGLVQFTLGTTLGTPLCRMTRPRLALPFGTAEHSSLLSGMW